MFNILGVIYNFDLLTDIVRRRRGTYICIESHRLTAFRIEINDWAVCAPAIGTTGKVVIYHRAIDHFCLSQKFLLIIKYQTTDEQQDRADPAKNQSKYLHDFPFR